MVLEELEDREHDVVDVAEAARLRPLRVVEAARPVDRHVGEPVVELHRAVDRAAGRGAAVLVQPVEDRAVLAHVGREVRPGRTASSCGTPARGCASSAARSSSRSCRSSRRRGSSRRGSSAWWRAAKFAARAARRACERPRRRRGRGTRAWYLARSAPPPASSRHGHPAARSDDEQSEPTTPLARDSRPGAWWRPATGERDAPRRGPARQRFEKFASSARP